MLTCCFTMVALSWHLLIMQGRAFHQRIVTRNMIENMEIMKININEKVSPDVFNNLNTKQSEQIKISEKEYHINYAQVKEPVSNKSVTAKKVAKMTKLQLRAKACTFYDPLINKSNPVMCGAQNFVSIVRSRCRTRLGNQLSAYAAVRYFQHKYGMTPLLEPFQMKIIKSVFAEGPLTVRGLNLDICCPERKKWKMILALKEDKRTGIATGLSEKFQQNPDYYSRNFLIGLGHHTMPVFLFKGGINRFQNNLISILYLLEILPQLRKEFVFKKRISYLANRMIQQIRKSEQKPNLVFVGIHARRGDRIQKWKQRKMFRDTVIGIYEGKFSTMLWIYSAADTTTTNRKLCFFQRVMITSGLRNTSLTRMTFTSQENSSKRPE